MKATFSDLKRNNGEIKLLPESIDDLWHLSHMIEPGNLVFATTLRSVEQSTDRIRPDKAEKRPVRIGLLVEKVEFVPDATRLRISGIIREGPDQGFHHSLNVETGYDISIIRRWRRTDLDRIDRAVKSSLYDVIHIVALEEGEAEICRIRQYGPERVTTMTRGSGKTRGENSRQTLFLDLMQFLSQVTGPVVIAGPGFIKEEFGSYVKAQSPDLFKRMAIVETRRSGYGAIQQAIGDGVLDRVALDLQLAQEVRAADEVFKRIARDDPVAYGIGEVSRAVSFGAAEELIVADTSIRNPDVSAVMEEAEQMNVQMLILSTEFEPGKRIEGLGGIAALLRYAIG
ncbi:MAG: mRNA surveillance protein pelota [Methanocalculus sp. MSAO_Arc1]|uniref:mRNA surveillance protein pelota n=1 Tax=Methanocalculus TaxID=71151 RepID=UPI000FF39887|nr:MULTISPECIES: mRNA surveillance protein pelota [unclassified Methanocalculus]MCP1661942.1 protein pelota [Methanocalculus sp. AMF5]RQD80545.1 MAG: mRNA surveillance protein pelota [Methanocalculus sp. MSAO_Arc1]